MKLRPTFILGVTKLKNAVIGQCCPRICDYTANVIKEVCSTSKIREHKGCLPFLLSYFRNLSAGNFWALTPVCQLQVHMQWEGWCQGDLTARSRKAPEKSYTPTWPCGHRHCKIYKWSHGTRRHHFGVPESCRSQNKATVRTKIFPY